MHDPMHFPHPLPRLTQEMLIMANTHAFGLESTFVNNFAFMKDFAPPPPTPEVLEKGVVRIWEDEFVPAIAAWCERVRSTDYDSMSAEQIAAMLPGLLIEAGNTFKYTMIVVFPFMGPTLGLVEAAEHALGEDGPLLVASLLQGYANETSLAGAGLGDLSALAAASPEVSRALREGRFGDLGKVTGGAEFEKALDSYLEKYGWRVDDWSLLHVPTWAESKDKPLRLIAAYLGDGSGTPDASLQKSQDIRAAAEAELHSRLSGEALQQILGMLAVAQPHVSMSEGRARWQLTIVGSLRVPLLALGRKLRAAGALAEANDAVYLTTDELLASAKAPSRDTVALVAQRKAELEASKQLQPPPFLGAPPDMSQAPPEAALVMRRFFGIGVEPSTDRNVINGFSGSKGVARGRARVIKELSDADRLEAGDILVCKLTAPPWTPVFAIAAAVVTDTGGVLSHSAICAREFGIPCVVGTQFGTAVIPDGAMITVDGDNGVVRLD
jgi:pyruvate,water dikinase